MSLEVCIAVDIGYKVLKVFEIWQYETTEYDQVTGKGGLFAEYINKFFAKTRCCLVIHPNVKQKKKSYVTSKR